MMRRVAQVDLYVVNRMKRFAHVPGALYRIMEGVRRARAAQMLGHIKIRAEVIDSGGQSLGEAEIPSTHCDLPRP
jgi:hypothetical protein